MQERNELDQFRKRSKRNLAVGAVVTLVVLLLVCSLLIKDSRKKKEELKQLKATIEEMEQKRIQTDIIREELEQISKYSAYEMNYTSVLFYSEANQIFGMDIPLTKNRLLATIDGKMNIGIHAEKVEFSTKADAKGNITEVTALVPHSEILDNYTDQDTLQIYDETNNIFNPVKVENYSKLIVDSEKKEEEKVLRSDVLTQSDERIQKIITSYLHSVFGEDVKIQFSFLTEE